MLKCDVAGRTESGDAALDLFLRIFGRRHRGIISNLPGDRHQQKRCITDRPSIFSNIWNFHFLSIFSYFWNFHFLSIFSYIWNFHFLSIFSCIWNFHFLGRRGEQRLSNCWMQVAEYIAAPVARERPVADSSSLHNLARPTTTLPTFYPPFLPCPPRVDL